MAQNTLEVSIRTNPGKSGAKEIRKEGNIPAILYGKGTEPTMLAVNPAADRKSTRLNSSHIQKSRMPSSA